jgi:hypothetical protein
LSFNFLFKFQIVDQTFENLKCSCQIIFTVEFFHPAFDILVLDPKILGLCFLGLPKIHFKVHSIKIIVLLVPLSFKIVSKQFFQEKIVWLVWNHHTSTIIHIDHFFFRQLMAQFFNWLRDFFLIDFLELFLLVIGRKPLPWQGALQKIYQAVPK